MEKEQKPIQSYYYKYGKTTDEKIIEYLNKIKVVKLENKGVGTIHGYYPLTKDVLEKIKNKPRNVSLTFDATETESSPVLGLEIYKNVTYLVKSTSRFFLKPDIGEIFDQIDFRDLYDGKIKAIEYLNGYETLDGTDGEHFLMSVNLLR